MPSSYSSSARFTLQAPGEGTNTWGIILNTGVFALVDTNINGMLSFALSGAKTLTTANGATDEARNAMLNVTGGTGGTITIPSVSKAYLVRNASSGNVVLTTGSGRTATVAPPASAGTAYAVVMCDGTNCDRQSNQTEIDAALTAAKAYTDAATTQSGNLPSYSGNAGRYLTTDGFSASWAAVGTAIGYSVGSSSGQIPVLGASGLLTVSSLSTPSISGASATFSGIVNATGSIQTASNVNAGINLTAIGYAQVGASGSGGFLYFGSAATKALSYTSGSGFGLNDSLSITTPTSTPFNNFYNGSTLIGQITNNGATVSYNNLSDARYKTKVGVPDTGAIVDDVGGLVVTYDMKLPGQDVRRANGVFAQELFEVQPGWVSPGDDVAAPGEKGFKPWMISLTEAELVLFREVMLLRKRVADLGG